MLPVYCHDLLNIQLCIAGMRVVDAEYKLQKNIKIAMLYLEDDDAVNAETFIKKAATLITGTKVMFASLPSSSCRRCVSACNGIVACQLCHDASERDRPFFQ